MRRLTRITDGLSERGARCGHLSPLWEEGEQRVAQLRFSRLTHRSPAWEGHPHMREGCSHMPSGLQRGLTGGHEVLSRIHGCISVLSRNASGTAGQCTVHQP